MVTVYAQSPFPNAWSSSLFLAGPTPRSQAAPSWRPEALRLLEQMGFGGAVFVPESEGDDWKSDYEGQIAWETEGLNLADIIVFWVPRELEHMPAFTTNVEFGRWVDSGKCVLGFPERAPKMRYLEVLIEQTGEEATHTLQQTLARALTRLGEGALRSGGERCVPLYLWKTPMLQSWYRSLRAAGNRLERARVCWAYRENPASELFAFVLWAEVWIEEEQRSKSNEWVFARTDVCAVVLYRKAATLLDTQIVLVREFRTPGRTPDGFVHELPSGSSAEGSEVDGSVEMAAQEVEEETSLVLPITRFVPLGSRPLAATVSSHHSHAFAVELSEEEMQHAVALAEARAVRGVLAATERTTLTVVTLGALLQEGHADWSVLGMVARALLR